jgi:hypothetical protein
VQDGVETLKNIIRRKRRLSRFIRHYLAANLAAAGFARRLVPKQSGAMNFVPWLRRGRPTDSHSQFLPFSFVISRYDMLP